MFGKFLESILQQFNKPDIKAHGASLLNAKNYDQLDLGEFKWNSQHNSQILSILNNGETIEWGPRKPEYEAKYFPAFVPISTCAHFHSGHFEFEFVVEEMAKAQIGIGFMLLWDVGVDWGFFGYLGASNSAWSYDPSTGDVVTQTKSIQGGLPTFKNLHSGTVTVSLELPRDKEGKAWFSVEGTRSKSIRLPAGSVVMPAACLLAETQKVTLANLVRRNCG